MSWFRECCRLFQFQSYTTRCLKSIHCVKLSVMSCSSLVNYWTPKPVVTNAHCPGCWVLQLRITWISCVQSTRSYKGRNSPKTIWAFCLLSQEQQQPFFRSHQLSEYWTAISITKIWIFYIGLSFFDFFGGCYYSLSTNDKAWHWNYSHKHIATCTWRTWQALLDQCINAAHWWKSKTNHRLCLYAQTLR